MKIDQPQAASVAGFTLIVTVLLLIPARSLVAQSQAPQKPAPDVQQLKERLLQLEQTVEQLKAQIESVEDSQKKSDVVTFQKASASVPATAEKPQGDDKKGESTLRFMALRCSTREYQFKQADPNWFDTVRPREAAGFQGSICS